MSSLRSTIQSAFTRAAPRRCRSRDERVLEICGTRPFAQLLGRALRDDMAVRDDHDAVAERRDLLHHVARQQHAAALGAQSAEEAA